jgi:membrane-bound ClpP family serine protease
MPVLGIACLLLAMFPFVYAPVGAGAALMIAGLVARRWIVAERNGLSRQVPQTSVSG